MALDGQQEVTDEEIVEAVLAGELIHCASCGKPAVYKRYQPHPWKWIGICSDKCMEIYSRKHPDLPRPRP
jgi:hypothetical protein